MQNLTENQAINAAKKQFCDVHNLTRLPKNCQISVHPRYSGGRYVLISDRKGKTTEFYFQP